jgi:hypothetical protein
MHERLAENVAIAGDCSLTEARAILALIAERLADDAYETAQSTFADGDNPAYTEDFLTMLAASPLVRGEKGWPRIRCFTYL